VRALRTFCADGRVERRLQPVGLIATLVERDNSCAGRLPAWNAFDDGLQALEGGPPPPTNRALHDVFPHLHPLCPEPPNSAVLDGQAPVHSKSHIGRGIQVFPEYETAGAITRIECRHGPDVGLRGGPGTLLHQSHKGRVATRRPGDIMFRIALGQAKHIHGVVGQEKRAHSAAAAQCRREVGLPAAGFPARWVGRIRKRGYQQRTVAS